VILATIWAVILAAAAWTPARGDDGPNTGGFLILHYNPALKFTLDTGYDGRSGLADCEAAVTTVGPSTHPGDEAGAVLFVLAAFPAPVSPRVQTVAFGLDHTLAPDQIAAWGPADPDSALWSTSGAWPSSGSGFQVQWQRPIQARLFEVCWFGVDTGTAGETAWLDLTHHPLGLDDLEDDGAPPRANQFEDFGRVGFGMPGRNPCAPVPVLSTTWGRIKIEVR
jgi:hypothetical protein